MDGSEDPRRIVRDGYERIDRAYLRWNEDEPSAAQTRHTRMACEEIPAGARVLELGCGPGWPTLQALARRFRAVGVDVSRTQLALAAERAPAASLVESDLLEVAFVPGVFQAVVSFYVLLHVPRERWMHAFSAIHRWLAPGGLLYLCVGTGDDPGSVEADFLGGPMFFSGWDPPGTIRSIRDAGFEIVRDEVDRVVEHGAGSSFLWVVARKPDA